MVRCPKSNKAALLCPFASGVTVCPHTSGNLSQLQNHHLKLTNFETGYSHRSYPSQWLRPHPLLTPTLIAKISIYTMLHSRTTYSALRSFGLWNTSAQRSPMNVRVGCSEVWLLLMIDEVGTPQRGALITEVWGRQKTYWINKAKRVANLPQAQHPALAPPPKPSGKDKEKRKKSSEEGSPNNDETKRSKERVPEKRSFGEASGTESEGNGKRPGKTSQNHFNNEPKNGDGKRSSERPHRKAVANRAANIDSGFEEESDDSSSHQSGELSPTYVLRNDPLRGHMISPTSGQRKSVALDLKGKWKFARTLFQRDVVTTSTPAYPGIAPKNMWLFVLLDEDENIVDVSCAAYMRFR